MADTLIVFGSTDAAECARRAGYGPVILDPTRELADVMRDLAGLPNDAPVLVSRELAERAELHQAITLNRPLIGTGPQAVAAMANPDALQDVPPVEGLKLRRRWWQRLLRRISKTPEVTRAVTLVYAGDGWSSRFVGGLEGGKPFEFPKPTQRAAASHVGVVLGQRHDLRGIFQVLVHVDERGVLWPKRCDPWFDTALTPLDRSLQRPMVQGLKPRRVRETVE